VTARQCHIRVALEGRSNRESHNLIMIGHVTPWGLHFRAPLPQPPSTSTGERDEAKGRNKKSPNPEPSFLVCRLLSLPPFLPRVAFAGHHHHDGSSSCLFPLLHPFLTPIPPSGIRIPPRDSVPTLPAPTSTPADSRGGRGSPDQPGAPETTGNSCSMLHGGAVSC
jgi:hypothetical protein